MANVNLSRMTVEALMDLRQRVDETLVKRRADMERQLERMSSAIAVVGGRGGRGGSGLRGRTVPPKYRRPSGETWAVPDATPRSLVDAVKCGNIRDSFLIDNAL